MNEFEKKIFDDNCKKGVLNMLNGNECRFIGVISSLQELCSERKDLEDILNLECLDDDLDIDELWKLDPDVMLDHFDIQDRNDRREEALEKIRILFNILDIKFEDILNKKQYAS